MPDITQAAINAVSPQPLRLTGDDSVWTLTEDIVADFTAFYQVDQNITIDLNGFNLTFNNKASIAATNDSFESGGLGNSAPGWTFSGTDVNVIGIPTNHFHSDFGSQCVQFTTTATTEGTAAEILSDAITLPTEAFTGGNGGNGKHIVAIATPSSRQTNNWKASLEIVDASGNTWRGTPIKIEDNQPTRAQSIEVGVRLLASEAATLGSQVRLKLRVWSDDGNPTAVKFDHVTLMWAGNNAFCISSDNDFAWFSNYTAATLSDGTSSGRMRVTNSSATASTIREGVQGFECHAFHCEEIAQDTSGDAPDDVALWIEPDNSEGIIIETQGTNSTAVNGESALGQMYIRNVLIDCDMFNVSNRFERHSDIRITGCGWDIDIDGCRFIGQGQSCVNLSSCQGTRQKIVQNCVTEDHFGYVTNSYAFVFVECQSLFIDNNTIGGNFATRGILVDKGGTTASTISNNTITTFGISNREFGDNSLENTGIRYRDSPGEGATDLLVYNNTVTCTTGPGQVHQCMAFRAKSWVDGCQVTTRDNTFETSASDSKETYAWVVDGNVEGSLIRSENDTIRFDFAGAAITHLDSNAGSSDVKLLNTTFHDLDNAGNDSIQVGYDDREVRSGGGWFSPVFENGANTSITWGPTGTQRIWDDGAVGKVTVTKNALPVEDAIVSSVDGDTPPNLSVHGLTNASGQADAPLTRTRYTRTAGGSTNTEDLSPHSVGASKDADSAEEDDITAGLVDIPINLVFAAAPTGGIIRMVAG